MSKNWLAIKPIGDMTPAERARAYAGLPGGKAPGWMREQYAHGRIDGRKFVTPKTFRTVRVPTIHELSARKRSGDLSRAAKGWDHPTARPMLPGEVVQSGDYVANKSTQQLEAIYASRPHPELTRIIPGRNETLVGVVVPPGDHRFFTHRDLPKAVE